MADRANGSQGAGVAPTADGPSAVRNVVLVGPSGGGKTTLVEALLVAGGVLPRQGSVVVLERVPDYHLTADKIGWNSSSNFRSPSALPFGSGYAARGIELIRTKLPCDPIEHGIDHAGLFAIDKSGSNVDIF